MLITVTSISSCQSNFDQKKWLENNDLSNTKNPRANMTKDLMNNYLKVGMKKEEIIELLGDPSSDTLSVYLPKNLHLPDSLNLLKSKEDPQKALDLVNIWFKNNSKEAHLMYYPVGWSMIDPRFLVIRLDNDKLIADFWIEEH